MSAVSQLPLSGYVIRKVYQTVAEMGPRLPSETSSEDEEQIGFSWDWRVRGRHSFEVRLELNIDARKGRPYYAKVDAVGQFGMTGAPDVKFEDFVCLQAVAVLLPYARQYLTNLTVNSLQGPYFLPSLNVVKLMADFDYSKTTGAKQLEQKGAILEGLKEPEDGQHPPPPTATSARRLATGKR